MQDQVFREHTRAELIVKPEPPHLELVHRQALAGQNIAHLARADAKGNRTKGTMGGRVRVTASHGHAGLCQTQFGSNHMHDALAATSQPMQRDPMTLAVALQGAEHFLSEGIREGACLACGGNNVIHRGHGALRAAHRQALVVQSGKGLRTRDLMDQMQANQQLRGSTRKISNTVQIPDLVVERAAAHSPAK